MVDTKLTSRCWSIAGLLLLLWQIAAADDGPSTAIQPATWISHPETGEAPVVLRFRRELTLKRLEKSFSVQVSADNRFVLYVNGKRVGAGPTQSDLARWHYERFDLAPYLRKGDNVIAATVWNFSLKPRITVDMPEKERRAALNKTLAIQTGRAAQISARTAFALAAEQANNREIDTDARWRVRVDGGHSVSPLLSVKPVLYYVAGAAESIDGEKTDWAWNAPVNDDGGWVAAVAALAPDEPAPWSLRASSLPPMKYERVDSGQLVRADLNGSPVSVRFPVTLPAGSRARLLIQRDAMVSAYPQLVVSGGRGARISVTYTEALYDAKGKKGVRDQVGDNQAIGLTDTFLADGGRRTFAPLWWRTWRFAEIAITTGAEPVHIEQFVTYETGFPFERRGYFRSSDNELNSIWDVGWRTALIDAHETYMDTSYWEQLQYVGDTRLQMLISYAVAGDDRLAVQAIDAFGWSNADGGLTEGAYPSSLGNIIPPFSLLWIGMMHDYWMHRSATDVLTRNLPRARQVLDWYAAYQSPNGLLRKNPHWNFVDWASLGGKPLPRHVFPSFDEQNQSCLTTLIYLGALDQAAELERSLGDPQRATSNSARAESARAGIREHCWDEQRGLFADDPGRTRFSQHTNALAILYGVARPEDAGPILDRIVAGDGIAAPQDIVGGTYYFAWYLVRAFERAGLSDRYGRLLDAWRQLLELKFTTWPEELGDTRSDTHAWSAHPTADLLAVVAGIQPAVPGYSSLRIAPHLIGLKSLEAGAQTPRGPVTVRYRVHKGKLRVTVAKPTQLPGVLVWKGKEYCLAKRKTRLLLDM